MSERPELREVTVDEHVIRKGQRDTHLAIIDARNVPKMASRNNEFVYVNSAYVGSLNSVNENRLEAPPTSVVREQYWACSKWPFGQRMLAIAVGILIGAVIGLAVTVALRNVGDGDGPFPGGIFRSNPAPD